MIMMDSAFALSAGIVFLALVFLFHSLNILIHKFKNRSFDPPFAFIFALSILCISITFSRIMYMGTRYPWMDYKGIVSQMLYLPFTLSATALSMLILIKSIIGETYPKRWRTYAIISGLIAIVCYAAL